MYEHKMSFTWDSPEKRYVCSCGVTIYTVDETDANPLRTALDCQAGHIQTVLQRVRSEVVSDLFSPREEEPADFFDLDDDEPKPEWSRGFTYDDLYAERDCS